MWWSTLYTEGYESQILILEDGNKSHKEAKANAYAEQ